MADVTHIVSGREWRRRAEAAEAKVKIAEDALEFIVAQQDNGRTPLSAGVIAHDALIQMSVVE